MLATVALVGRPNVGKSTLFNRLLRRSVAITHDLPGVTRDRIFEECQIKGVRFGLVDTGGMVLESEATPELSKDFEDEIFEQAREAILEANAIVLVVDGKEGMTPLDEQAAEFVRKSGKPVLLLINKVDGSEVEAAMCADFYSLGLDMLPVSAAHGYKLNEARERVAEMVLDLGLPDEEEDDVERGVRITMLGRPNAGKSSMVNAIIGEKRLIVSDVAGTTRDSIDVTFEQGGKRYTFVDTAGVRRRTNITEQLEHVSVLRALKNSRRSDVTVLVIDGTDRVSRQDKRLIEFLVREKVPFMVAVNKVDLIERSQSTYVMDLFRKELRIVPHVPVFMTSTLKKVGVGKILPLAESMKAECAVRVGTGALNRALESVIQQHQPPVVKRRRPKFYYITQADEEIPTFVFFVNDHTIVKESYMRYLENQLRKLFGIKHAPVRVYCRSSHEKKDGDKRRGMTSIGKRGPGKGLRYGAKTRKQEKDTETTLRRRHKEKKERK